MNLIDAVVTEVISKPYMKYDKWWVDVIYESYGHPGSTMLFFDNYEDAEAVEKGYDFLT